jgi:predicted amidohydrolase
MVLYNSAAVINREGKPFFNTRKTHLYFADELWATEGDGFKNFELINCRG